MPSSIAARTGRRSTAAVCRAHLLAAHRTMLAAPPGRTGAGGSRRTSVIVPTVGAGSGTWISGRWSPRGQSLGKINVRLVHLSRTASGIAGQRLHIPPLPLREDGVKGKPRLARSGQPGEHDQRRPRGAVQISTVGPQVMLARSTDDQTVDHGRLLHYVSGPAPRNRHETRCLRPTRDQSLLVPREERRGTMSPAPHKEQHGTISWGGLSGLSTPRQCRCNSIRAV